MARIATERVTRGLRWLGTGLLLGGALVVIGGIALTRSIEALVTAASIAALAFAVPGAASFALAFWLEHAAERVERRAIAAMRPDGAPEAPVSARLLKYTLAAVAALCAWGARAWLNAYIPDEVPFITFYLAVAIAGWLGGFGPAALATLLSAVVAGILYVRPEAGVDVGRFALLGIFVLVCLGIAAIVSALHDALARAHELAHDAKRASELPKDMDTRLRALARSAPAALFMTDAAQACTYCNRAWLVFRGRTLTQELGDGWCEGVHEEDLARRREAFAHALASREPQSVVYRLRHADGGFRHVRDVVVAQVGARNEAIGLLGACFELEAIASSAQQDPAAALPH